MQVTKKLVLMGITGGSAGIGIIFILAAIFGFNSKSYYHDDKIGVQFGMKVDIETQESFAWARVPGALYIKSNIHNIFKVGDDGGKEESDFSALLPFGQGVHGSMDVRLQIFDASDTEDFPDMDARNQVVVPMAYISEDRRIVSSLRYFLMTWSIILKHWILVNVVVVLNAVGAILLGILLIYRSYQKKKLTVTEMKELDPPGPTIFSKLQNLFSKYKPGSAGRVL